MNLRLADFIRARIEPILQNWEEFAETIISAGAMSTSELRDHAREMLLAIADDLERDQSESEQTAKSKGHGPHAGEADEAAQGHSKSWAEVHGGDRQTSGFSVMEAVSEFRALRASVVSLWTQAHSTLTGQQLEDLTRFHEAIDQAVAESLERYANVKEMDTRLFGAVLLASPDPIHVLDLEGRFLYANKATCDLFGLASSEIIGKSTFDLGFPYASDFQRNLEKVIAERSSYRGRLVHTFASGEGDRFEYLLAPVLGEDERTESVVCICRDVTTQALAEEEAWHNAHHDLLTGLPNRRLFMDRLEQEIKHANRSSLPLAVLFMDLDGFKDVNDSQGHEAGDRLLSDVAQRLTDCVRDDDTVARLGGDEFCVILVEAKQRSGVELVAQTIIEALAMPFDIGPKPVHVSVSVGIAFYPGDAACPNALLEAADRAMYSAKKAGSSRMCFLDEVDPRHAPSRKRA